MSPPARLAFRFGLRKERSWPQFNVFRCLAGRFEPRPRVEPAKQNDNLPDRAAEPPFGTRRNMVAMRSSSRRRPAPAQQCYRQSEHLVALDGLCGVAALAVVIFHSTLWSGLTILPRAFLAVDLFLVLSGFVLALVYQDKLTQNMSLGRFMSIRVARLLPVLLLGALLGWLANDSGSRTGIQPLNQGQAAFAFVSATIDIPFSLVSARSHSRSTLPSGRCSLSWPPASCSAPCCSRSRIACCRH